MPTALRNFQWELADLNEVSALVFGTADTGYLTLTRPSISDPDVVSATIQRPQEDGVFFGRDYYGGRTVGFDMGVLTDKASGLATAGAERANLDAIDAFESQWRHHRWRNKATATAMLRRCMVDGRVSRVYGRPGRFDAQEGNLTDQGYTPLIAEFQTMDGLWYADTEQFMDVTLPASTNIGITTPLIGPITTTPRSQAEQPGIVVGGSRSTWPVVTFTGPVTGPRLTIIDNVNGNQVFALRGDVVVPGGVAVVIDTRPWVRSVTRLSDGGGLGGLLSPDTPPMINAAMRPGAKSLSFSGLDVTGTARAQLRWRDARSRP